MHTHKQIQLLPSVDKVHWSMHRKAQLVQAIHGGIITVEEACERYRLFLEELNAWGNLLRKHGMRGLRSTYLQNYRETRKRESKHEAI